MPAIANCASEIWPAYPVTTTTDNMIMLATIVTVTAMTQAVGRKSIAITTHTILIANGPLRIRPSPTPGRRNLVANFPGTYAPRMDMIITMTMNGTASDQPGGLTYVP